MQRTIRARLCFGNAVMMGFVMFSCTDSQNKRNQKFVTTGMQSQKLSMHPSTFR